MTLYEESVLKYGCVQIETFIRVGSASSENMTKRPQLVQRPTELRCYKLVELLNDRSNC